MATYKITAIKDVEVSAYIWIAGNYPNVRDREGTSIRQGVRITNEEQSFYLEEGESREDVSFLSMVDGKHFGAGMPQKLNEAVKYQDALLIEKTSDSKPTQV